MLVGMKLKRRGKRLISALVVAILGICWGGLLLETGIGTKLRHLSYDLPFLFTEHAVPGDIVIVYLDEYSHEQLGQPLARAWDRRLHAKLVDRLHEEGARMVVFDILFHDEDPQADALFAEAIANHGQVILCGEWHREMTDLGPRERLLLATPELRRAAAGWGLTDASIDSDGTIRRIRHAVPTSDFGPKPTMSAMVDKLAGGSGWDEFDEGQSTLLNYYGPSGSFRWHSYSTALSGVGLPEGAFQDKIVLVGARQKAGLADAGKDTFPTPHTIRDRVLMPGVEINATAAANLMDGLSMEEVSPTTNWMLLVGSSCALSMLACLLPPIRGLLLCLFAALGMAVVGILFHHSQATLFAWTIPAFGQAPLIAGLALGGHYLIEYSARWKLRRAFKSYMSDEQARQIDEDDVSLELGGKEVEATILFSDLAGFTSMSEGLPPESVSKALISYFESATEGILDNQGTIIKYVGDAVMATWGAPLKVDREADRAIDAAIQMQLAGKTRSPSKPAMASSRKSLKPGSASIPDSVWPATSAAVDDSIIR